MDDQKIEIQRDITQRVTSYFDDLFAVNESFGGAGSSGVSIG